MIRVFLYGSSLDNEQTANDVDLIVVSNKPIDICVYSETEWNEFEKSGISTAGKRVVLHPNQGIKSWPSKRQAALFLGGFDENKMEEE